MSYNEELSLHKSPIHFEDYLALSESERKSNAIYFIDDVSSDTELINKLIEKIDQLKSDLVAAGILTGG